MTIEVGSKAPNFALPNQFGETVALADLLAEGPVALVFFPLAFSGICTGELCELRDNLELFGADGVSLVACSVDSKFSLRVWGEREGYEFQLLSDFWPHGAVAQSFGAFVEEAGIANRATFLIDTDGTIRASIVTEPGQARDFTAYREALAQLTA